MTMKPIHSVPAGEFKAKCLDILDRVAKSGEAYVVTKRGKPVAKVVPIESVKPRSLLGSVTVLADITVPTEEEWPLDEGEALYDE